MRHSIFASCNPEHLKSAKKRTMSACTCARARISTGVNDHYTPTWAVRAWLNTAVLTPQSERHALTSDLCKTDKYEIKQTMHDVGC